MSYRRYVYRHITLHAHNDLVYIERVQNRSGYFHCSIELGTAYSY